MCSRGEWHVGPTLSTILKMTGVVGLGLYLTAVPETPLLLGSLLALALSQFMPSAGRVDPHGKAVFITGCDSGFGWSLAKELDTLGYQVFAGCLLPDGEGAASLKAQCSPSLYVVRVDVTNNEQVQDAVREVHEHMLPNNQLWAVVNNAGIAVINEVEWCSVSQYERIMDVNVFGVVRVTKAFLPDLRRSRGRVVTVASLAGRYTYPSFTAYSMSKSASISFSDGLRREMSKFGVKVVTVEPGLYRTGINSEKALFGGVRKAWAESPTEVKDCYGEEYFAAYLDKMYKVLNTARPNIEEVVDMMTESVVAVDPLYRYVPHWVYRVRSTIIMYLPTGMADSILVNLLTPSVRPKYKAE